MMTPEFLKNLNAKQTMIGDLKLYSYFHQGAYNALLEIPIEHWLHGHDDLYSEAMMFGVYGRIRDILPYRDYIDGDRYFIHLTEMNSNVMMSTIKCLVQLIEIDIGLGKNEMKLLFLDY